MTTLLRNRALNFAARAHRDQLRKGTKETPDPYAHNEVIGLGVPYIAHVAGVGMLLLEHGAPEELVAAGILHDVLEDTSVTYDMLTEAFGVTVAELVQAESEPDKNLPWRERKEQTLIHLRSAPLDVRLIAAADKLHNVQSMMLDLELIGLELWNRFNAPFDEQAWYYYGVSRAVRGDDPEAHPLFAQLERAVGTVFGPYQEVAETTVPA